MGKYVNSNTHNPVREHMRILFVVPGYEPALAFGGTATGQATLARALVSIGHHVSVYATNSDGRGNAMDVPVNTPIERDGVQVTYFPCTFGPDSVFDSRQLLNAVRRNVKNFDMVYLLALYQWIGIEIPYICKKQGVPVVFHIAGGLNPVLLRKSRFKKTLWRKFFLKRALKKCSALHLTGNYEREQTFQQLKWSENYLVPNCVDVLRFRPSPESKQALRERYGVSQTAPVLISVGRFDPKKRIDLVIRALAVLKNKDIECYLLLVGDNNNPAAEEYKTLSEEMGVSNRIIWTGILAGEELVAAYSASDLFVHLSHDENFGIVVSEAMGTGLPVLISPGVGIWHELQGEDIGECTELDVDSVVKSLLNFCYNRQRWSERGQRGTAVAKKLFDAQKVAGLMARAFEDVISGERSKECRWHIPKVSMVEYI